jgi:hypothetical protein
VDALHAKDLEAIQEHTNKILAEACSKSEIEITTFKVDLKAQHMQCKADLEQDAILARHTLKKPHPNPINTLRSRRSMSCSTSHCPSPSHSETALMEPMNLDTNEPSAPQEENSPTPTNDGGIPIPVSHASEAPSKHSKLDDIISMMHKGFENMGNIINSKLEKALAPINTRL